MKIAVISTPVFAIGQNGVNGLVGYGGLEQLAWQQAAGLAAKGHEVFLMAPDGSTCPGATVIPIGPAGQTNEHMAFQKYWKKLVP